MNILIDADGCPVVDLTLQIAKRFVVPVIILCDTAHQIEREGAQTLVFDKGADSVDFALVNRVKPGDIVVTQDYGLASMCLAKCARVLNQNGLEYTADNIDALMLRRYENKKLLRAGKHPKGSPKRTKEIGVLRSIGASKKDISRVFNAETIIIGFVAGLIGIGVTIDRKSVV